MAEPTLVAAILGGASGGGVLGFVSALVTVKTNRESSFQKRIDAELTALRAEVAECREERPQIQILKMGLCMTMPELSRLDPGNPTLRSVANAFAALPKDDSSFDELLKQIDESEKKAAETGE